MIICPHCKMANPDGSSTCHGCWHDLPRPVVKWTSSENSAESADPRRFDFQQVAVAAVTGSDPEPMGWPLTWLRFPLGLLAVVCVFGAVFLAIYSSWGRITGFLGTIVQSVAIFFVIFCALGLMVGRRLPDFGMVFDLALWLLSQIAGALFRVLEYVLLRRAIGTLLPGRGNSTVPRLPVRNVMITVPGVDGHETIRVVGNLIRGDFRPGNVVSLNVRQIRKRHPLRPLKRIYEKRFVSGFNHTTNSWIKVSQLRA
jgi:hypothetical protein